MRKLLFFIASALALFAYIVTLSLHNPSIISDELEPPNFPGFHDYRGVINVQSTNSSGFESATELLRKAQDAKLDFIIFTELNDFTGRRGPSGWNRQTFVLQGKKFGYVESRVISLGSETLEAAESLGQAQTMIADYLSRPETSQSISAQDRLLLTRPPESRSETNKWDTSILQGVSGLEAINLQSVAHGAIHNAPASFAWSAMIYPFNSKLAALRLFADIGNSSPEFDEIDRLAKDRPVFATLGSDVGRPLQLFGIPLRLPTAEVLFRLASNHLLLRSELTGDPESDRRKILLGIAQGQTYLALDAIGNPKGFAAWFEDDSGTYPIGSRVTWRKAGGRISVHLPKRPNTPFETAILRDGQVVMTSNSVDTQFSVNEPGVYRVVVRAFLSPSLFDGGRWLPWIWTNPITLLERGPANEVKPEAGQKPRPKRSGKPSARSR
jgi:hypothetical protein